MKPPAVYIMSSDRNGTLYIGVTSNLERRVWIHKSGIVDGFTKRNGLGILVWFESHPTMASAILREKQIKKWRRQWKLALIEKMNLHWEDLFEKLG